MSRSDWNILAPLAGLAALSIAFGLGSYVTALDDPQQGYPSYRYSGQEVAAPNAAGPSSEVASTPQYRTPCHQPQSEGEADLCAQWRAAHAAEKSALWTKLGFWAGLFGLAGLYWQVVLTRRAVEDTGEATEAMREANAIARDIGQAQTRAYLSIRSLEGKKVDGGLVFRATVQNSGQSPALSAQIMLQVVDKDGEKIQVLPEHEHHIPAQSAPILAYCYFKSEQATAWPGIVIIATVAYSDVFLSLDKIRETFAGIPVEWTEDEFTELTQGMHVA